MRKIESLILGMLLYTFVVGQENTANIWYFGDHAGVSFATGIPVALTDGQIDNHEGCATICDGAGALLFYTDGITVWNKNHLVMPNGSGLMGNTSASQSSIITPYPLNDTLFIVFTIDARENGLVNGLRYSIININLDGGLGDITSEKNILLHAPVSERLTSVIKSNQHDYWIIVHDWGNSDFLSYSVTSTGVDPTPVTTSIGTSNVSGGDFSQQYSIGCMKASRNGQRIAVANYRNSGFFELFDFDSETGILSNVRTSPSTYYRPYGVEFSRNGDILYGSIDGSASANGKIYQFDLTLPSPLSSGTLIGSSTHHTPGLQLGPNGKIYVTIKDYNYLGVINYPNVLGVSCNFIHDAVNLNEGVAWRGLPSLFYNKGFQFFTGSEVDTSICEGDSIFLENAYQFVADTYYDTVSSHLGWDSIINTHLTVLEAIANPTVSESSGILTSSTATNYQWYFNGTIIVGATNQSYQPFITGNYQVAVDNGNGCFSFSDIYYYFYSNIVEIENNIEIYPNPFSDKLIISCKNTYSLEISDVDGRIIFEANNLTDIQTINTNHFEQGLYIIKVIVNKKTAYKKIVKI